MKKEQKQAPPTPSRANEHEQAHDHSIQLAFDTKLFQKRQI